MERFAAPGTIPPTYFRDADVLLLMYSIDKEDSIGNLKSWAEIVNPYRRAAVGAGESLGICALLGNKVDLEKGGKREVSTQRGENTAEHHDINIFREISALHGTGFDEFFNALVKEIEKKSRGQQKKVTNTIQVGQDVRRTDDTGEEEINNPSPSPKCC